MHSYIIPSSNDAALIQTLLGPTRMSVEEPEPCPREREHYRGRKEGCREDYLPAQGEIAAAREWLSEL